MTSIDTLPIRNIILLINQMLTVSEDSTLSVWKISGTKQPKVRERERERADDILFRLSWYILMWLLTIY